MGPQIRLQQVFPLFVWDFDLTSGPLFWGSSQDGNFACAVSCECEAYISSTHDYIILHRKSAALSGLDVPDETEKLQFLELCAGSHRLTDAALEYGYSALAMDVPSLNKYRMDSTTFLATHVCVDLVLTTWFIANIDTFGDPPLAIFLMVLAP